MKLMSISRTDLDAIEADVQHYIEATVPARHHRARHRLHAPLVLAELKGRPFMTRDLKPGDVLLCLYTRRMGTRGHFDDCKDLRSVVFDHIAGDRIMTEGGWTTPDSVVALITS